MSAVEFYDTCNSRIPKQRIEEYAKSMIDEQGLSLDQWKMQLLQVSSFMHNSRFTDLSGFITLLVVCLLK